MSSGGRSRSASLWAILLIGLIGIGRAWAQAPGPAATAPAPTQPATQAAEAGPDRVMLDALETLYEPVPFDHRTHARMAQMWEGCTTCHHRSPHPTTQPAEPMVLEVKTQNAAAEVPACKSCHEISAADVDLRMPNLKGAYHRQCLNCHREWMHGNACVICHKPKVDLTTQPVTPTVDDIVGRMHPPIPEPEEKVYKTRFTPVDGPNVLFRHKEHTTGFGLKCINCHHDDNCSHCHDPKADTSALKPVQPGRTWRSSHGPCMNCHKKDRCQHCHYPDEGSPPDTFTHEMTGQQLDADHAKLACGECHAGLKVQAAPTCGTKECHPKNPAIAYPAQRPGPVVAVAPVLLPATQPAPRPARRATSQPASAPAPEGPIAGQRTGP